MSEALRAVSLEEVARANAIEDWLSTYPSLTSQRTMLSSLRAIVRSTRGAKPNEPISLTTFPWEMLAERAFFSKMEESVGIRYGVDHKAKYVVAMRAFLKSMVMTGFAQEELARSTLAFTKVHQTTRESPDLDFTTEDLWNILRRCRQDPNPVKGRRDLALISSAASTGARRAEITRVDIADLDLKRRTLNLTVKGGGSKLAALHPTTIEHLEHWLTLRGEGAGALFPSLRKGGHVSQLPLSDHQYWKVLRERCGEADVVPAITPHDLRRWFVMSLLDSGVDVFQVARAVGHRRVETTFRYDRRSRNRLRAVIDALDLPGLADLEPLEEED